MGEAGVEPSFNHDGEGCTRPPTFHPQAHPPAAVLWAFIDSHNVALGAVAAEAWSGCGVVEMRSRAEACLCGCSAGECESNRAGCVCVRRHLWPHNVCVCVGVPQ